LLPDQSDARWVDRLIHERDLSLFGQRIAALTGVALNPREAEELTQALAAAYASLADVDGTTSSPCISTYLFFQQPDAFDLVVVELGLLPATLSPTPRAVVIYLHGFTGNFTEQACLVAQAAPKLNMLTVAPSVGFLGDWWMPTGEEAVRCTIVYLRGRGIERIYLAGSRTAPLAPVALLRSCAASWHSLSGRTQTNANAQEGSVPAQCCWLRDWRPGGSDLIATDIAVRLSGSL
jgi:hypothetical protein